MGWEYRPNGRRYLYRNRRVNGKPVKEYLAADDDFGFIMADDLRCIQKREAKVRRLAREVEQTFRKRIGGILAAADTANEPLRVIADALLTVAGFRKHHRGEWRMNRDLKKLAAEIGKLKDKLGEPRPMIWYEPPKGDAEAVEVYDLARKGDASAQTKLKELIRQRGWVDWVGDLGQQATRQLIIQATAGEKVWQEGVEQKVKAMNAELLGPNPGILERLLVRRVVNGWIAVHALELELAVRPPTNLKSKAYLDTAISRAQKRMTQAVGELARVRRLQAPLIVAHLTAPLPPPTLPALS